MTTNNITEPLGTGWGLWFGWVGVNFFAIIGSLLIFSCWFIILLFMGLIGSASPNIAQSNNFSILAYILFGLGFIICAITGAIIGALQKFILRNHFILERKWIIASTIGGELVLIFTLITYFLKVEFELLEMVTIALFTFGVAQWIVLRRQLPLSSWWILATVGSGLLGPLLSILNHPIAEFWYLASIVFFYPSLTGTVLIWLIGHATSTDYGSRGKLWLAGGWLLLMLIVIAQFTVVPSQPKYVDRHDESKVIQEFSEALRKNHGEIAKSLADPEQWGRIDTWVANRANVNCPRDMEQSSWHVTNNMVAEFKYICTYPKYYFSVQQIDIKFENNVYEILDWKAICETRNRQTVCE